MEVLCVIYAPLVLRKEDACSIGGFVLGCALNEIPKIGCERPSKMADQRWRTPTTVRVFYLPLYLLIGMRYLNSEKAW
ncbi:unnamed protein product [Nesidiocoris tenuis]|uniref:Uncharacterized protein n=1 Tax=Nesidiocoris tenuis TaxID=355587 RepID=A0A6H5GW21_9HEMI|nr:unnamed protein product [Nesidiocoris tenuis]